MTLGTRGFLSRQDDEGEDDDDDDDDEGEGRRAPTSPWERQRPRTSSPTTTERCRLVACTV